MICMHCIQNLSSLYAPFNLTINIARSIGGSTSRSAMRTWSINSMTTSHLCFSLTFAAKRIRRELCNLNSFTSKENTFVYLRLWFEALRYLPWSRMRRYTWITSHSIVLIWSSLMQLTDIFYSWLSNVGTWEICQDFDYQALSDSD